MTELAQIKVPDAGSESSSEVYPKADFNLLATG
jgi:hypothetical protein